MTKQIKLKNGTVLEVEDNDRCPCISGNGWCGVPTMEIHCSLCDDFPYNCPLEDWWEPETAPKERDTKKEDVCTTLCPDCHTLIHIESCSVISEKNAEITRLKNACEDKDHQLQYRWNRIQSDERIITEFAKENNRLFQTVNDLEKALQYKCQMREAAEAPKDEPELVICTKAELCCLDGCVHKKPHQKINHETGMNNCNRLGKCGGMTECTPVKKGQTVPQPECKYAEPEKKHVQCNKEGDCEHQIYFKHRDEAYCAFGEPQGVSQFTVVQQAHTVQIEVCQGRLDKLEESRDQHYKAQVSHTDYAVESRRRIEALEKEIATIREKE